MNTSNSATLQLWGMGRRIGHSASECIGAFADSLAGKVAPASSCRSMIMADDSGLKFFARMPAGWRLVAAADQPSDAGLSALKKQLKGLPRGGAMVRAGAGRAVIARLALPAAAADVLPAVVRNKVESLAPWPLAEALWGYREAGTMEDGHIAVDVGVVSRKTAFGLLRQIEATGIKVQRFEIAPDSETQDGIEIDIHGDDRRKGARRTLKAIMGVVAAAALGVGGYGAYLAYGTYKQSDALTQNIDRLHKSLRGNSATAAGSARLAEANTLYVRKLENRSALEILNTMTELVPDGIWLNTLDLDKNEITIAGRGNEVPGVIATLESSDAFKDVNFASATQREPDATADSFAISAIIETKPVKP